MRSTKRRLAVIAAVGAAAATVVTAAGPAMADRQAVNAAGSTTFQIASPFVKALQSGGCGALDATPTDGGTVVNGGNGKIALKVPVSGLVVTDTHYRINHTGGVVLSNECYEIRLTNFQIQNLGEGDQVETMDVLAKTKADDESGRTEVFTLDMFAPQFQDVNGQRVKFVARGANLLLGSDGADEFNELTSGDPTVGPFSTGEQIGKVHSTIRILFSDIISS